MKSPAAEYLKAGVLFRATTVEWSDITVTRWPEKHGAHQEIALSIAKVSKVEERS